MSTRVFAPALVLVAACGGGGSTDIEGTLRFAERSDAEIARLISAAGGAEMFLAEARIADLGDGFEEDPCPALAVDGATATLTGGCTRADGVEVRGVALVTNPLGWDAIEYQFGDDTVFEARQLELIDSGFSQTFDGVIRRTDGLTVYDADITVTTAGVAVRSDLFYECSNPSAPRCSLSGSGLELVGVGGARVSGSVRVDVDDNRQVADFTLTGADRLTVHLEDGCVAWAIEGTDRRMTCP